MVDDNEDALVILTERILDKADELQNFVDNARSGDIEDEDIQDAVYTTQLVNRYLDRLTQAIPELIERKGEDFLDRYEDLFRKLSETSNEVNAIITEIKQRGGVPSEQPSKPKNDSRREGLDLVGED